MGYPRSFLVDPLVGGVYHCVSRCVRRESLLESRDRSDWLVSRFEQLASIFAIDVCDFAVMRNHVHLLLRTHPELAMAWSDDEVVRRWLSISIVGIQKAEPAQADRDAALADSALVAEWRARLSDLGWFHKLWKEPAAKAWNREDAVTGHFWEGRYRSVGWADESAILMQATYILLNPLHCGLESELADSPRSSTGRRLKALMRSIKAGGLRQGVVAYGSALLEPAIPCDPGEEIPRMTNAEWSRRLAERTYERALRENAAEEARRSADRARRFDQRSLDAARAESAASEMESSNKNKQENDNRSENETNNQTKNGTKNETTSIPTDAPSPPEAPARPSGAASPQRLRSRTPTMLKRRLPDPPSSGNVANRINPWRDRSTLPMVGRCTLLAFVEFLDDRGRMARPDKRGRIDPAAPRAVDRLLARCAQAGASRQSHSPSSSRPANWTAARASGALTEAGSMLDEAESSIRDALASAVTSATPSSTGPPGITWRGTLAGSETASQREAERRGMRRAEALRPLAARAVAIST